MEMWSWLSCFIITSIIHYRTAPTRKLFHITQGIILIKTYKMDKPLGSDTHLQCWWGFLHLHFKIQHLSCCQKWSINPSMFLSCSHSKWQNDIRYLNTFMRNWVCFLPSTLILLISLRFAQSQCTYSTVSLPQSLPEGILKTLLQTSPGFLLLYYQKLMFAAGFILSNFCKCSQYQPVWFSQEDSVIVTDNAPICIPLGPGADTG